MMSSRRIRELRHKLLFLLTFTIGACGDGSPWKHGAPSLDRASGDAQATSNAADTTDSGTCRYSTTDWANFAYSPLIDNMPGHLTDAVSGPVEATAEGALRVLGFTILANPCTGTFDAISVEGDPVPLVFADIANGDSVEIIFTNHHWEDGNVLKARRVLRRPADDVVSIRGWLHDEANRDGSYVLVNGNVFRIDAGTQFFVGHQFYGDGPDGCSCAEVSADTFWADANSLATWIFGVIEVNGRIAVSADSGEPELVATAVYIYWI